MIAHPCCLLGTAKLCNSTEHITLTLWCLVLWLPSMLEEHHFQPKNKLMHFFSLIFEPAGTAQPRLPGQNCSIVLPQRLVAETVQEWASNKHFTTRLSCDIMKGFAGWWPDDRFMPTCPVYRSARGRPIRPAAQTHGSLTDSCPNSLYISPEVDYLY